MRLHTESKTAIKIPATLNEKAFQSPMITLLFLHNVQVYTCMTLYDQGCIRGLIHIPPLYDHGMTKACTAFLSESEDIHGQD